MIGQSPPYEPFEASQADRTASPPRPVALFLEAAPAEATGALLSGLVSSRALTPVRRLCRIAASIICLFTDIIPKTLMTARRFFSLLRRECNGMARRRTGTGAALWVMLPVLLFLAAVPPAQADATGVGGIVNAADHAPIGVMGDHTHARGEWMLSYRFMLMDMNGNRRGSTPITADAIAETIPNRFFGAPGQPPTLRIVPVSMSMQMHAVGAMYAPLERLTLTAMGRYLEKKMEHITYMGAAGAARRGRFRVNTSGLGDARVGALLNLWEQGAHRIHLNAGLSLPTGANDKTHRILAPNGDQPVMRVPYAMQLGSGTWDLMPGVTYSGRRTPWHWGGQYLGTFRTGSDKGYSLGDRHEFSAWMSRQWVTAASASVRLRYETAGRINGMDPQIRGPVQTADPDNYGGDVLNLGLGVNLVVLGEHRLAVEAALPLLRNLNGVQMETDWAVTVGWQYAPR